MEVRQIRGIFSTKYAGGVEKVSKIVIFCTILQEIAGNALKWAGFWHFWAHFKEGPACLVEFETNQKLNIKKQNYKSKIKKFLGHEKAWNSIAATNFLKTFLTR